jgi:hypothetical protein
MQAPRGTWRRLVLLGLLAWAVFACGLELHRSAWLMRPDRAVATIQEGVRATGKESPDLQFELAKCWLAKKQPDRALPLLRQVIQQWPDSKDVHEAFDRAMQMQSRGGA